MANEQMKETVYRLFDAFNRGDTTVITDLVSPNFTEHEDLGPGVPQNREGLLQFIKEIHRSFPDVHFEANDISVDGSRVWVRGVCSGTHRGDFMGAPATGKPFSVEFMDELQFDRNKIVEHWGQMDMMGMMQQLGMLQMSGTASH